MLNRSASLAMTTSVLKTDFICANTKDAVGKFAVIKTVCIKSLPNE